VRLKIAKHVDSAFDFSLDAGSIPATSTILRLKRSAKRRMTRRISFSYEGRSFINYRSKTTTQQAKMSKFYYVYILESQSKPNHFYTGSTTDIRKRLKKHNEGGCTHTAKFRPWHIKNYFAFDSMEKALKFEKYLKSDSRREFARRHF